MIRERFRQTVQRTTTRASLASDDSIHGRLRVATVDQHRLLDHGLRYLLAPELSTNRYSKLLAALFGFYVPLEEYFALCEAAPEPVALPLIRRAGLLERDLHAFGWAPVRIPKCDEMPRLLTIDHLAGAIYVVEGACLGGQVIARAVWQRLGIGRENGAAFFTGDGAETGARWRRVLDWLAERDRGRRRGQEDEILEGACRTFAALSAWLSARDVLDE